MIVLFFMKIGFCYNIRKNLPSKDPKSQIDAEFDEPETIAAIRKALESDGHTVYEIEANEKAYLKLYKLKNQIDIVFNIAEGFYGDAREAQIPAFCDMLQIPYTHSSTLTNAITLDKALTKKVLHFHGIKTPAFQLMSHADEKLNPTLKFPLLVKPNGEGSSKGVVNENLVYNKTNLYRRVKWILEAYHEPVIVEEFLSGREFTVSLLGNPPRVLPIIEQRLDRLPKGYAPFTSYEVKWFWEDSLSDLHFAYDCPAQIPPKLEHEITNVCKVTFNLLDCKDTARIDIRLDKKGVPHVLEINTLPGLIHDENVISYFPISARSAGFTFNSLILAILEAARKRYNLEP